MGTNEGPGILIKDDTRVSVTPQTKNSSLLAQGRPQTSDKNLKRNEGSDKIINKNRRTGAGVTISQLRISDVSGPQSRWENASDFQSAQSEQIPYCVKIPVDEYTENPGFPTASRLVGENRPIKRVLSSSRSEIAQKVLADNVQRQIVSNDVPAFRVSNCAESFCQSVKLGHPKAKGERLEGNCLFRRFSSSPPRQGNLIGASDRSRKFIRKSRLANKFSKVDTDSTEESGIFRDNLGPLVGNKESTSGKMHGIERKNTAHIIPKGSSPERNSKSRGSHKFCEFCSTERSFKPPRSNSICCEPTRRQFFSLLPSPPGEPKRIKVVVEASQLPVSHTQTTSNSLSSDRCFRNRMGSLSRQIEALGQLDSRRESPPLESKRDARGSPRATQSRPFSQGLVRNVTMRQQVDNSVHKEGRWYEILQPDEFDQETVQTPRSLQHSPDGSLHTWQVQRGSRPYVSPQNRPRMASSSRDNGNYFPEMGSARHRSDGITDSSRSTTVCQSEHARSGSIVSRRLQQELGFSTGVDFPPTFFDSKGALSSEFGERGVSNCSSPVGKSFLETGYKKPISRPAFHDTPPSPGSSGHRNRTAPQTSPRNDPPSLEMWGWTSHLKDWSPEQKLLLQSGWRQSSLKTYNIAWNRWLKWCSVNNVSSPSKPNGSQLARFLTDLFQKDKLSYRTILVYKSAVATLCNPHMSERLSSNFLVKKILRSIAIQNPRESLKPPIWDTDILTKYLKSSSCDENNFFSVLKKGGNTIVTLFGTSGT